MAALIRRDGEETRARILASASRIFADHGFTKATHAVIARDAGVNAALINFHFRSKENLYQAVWDRMLEVLDERYPLTPENGAEMSLEEKFHWMIQRSVLMSLKPEAEMFHRLHIREILAPTGILDNRIARHIKIIHTFMRTVIREYLGEKATEDDVLRTEMLVFRICHVIPPPPVKHARKHNQEWRRFMQDSDEVIGMTHAFCMAGLKRVKTWIDARGDVKKEKV